MRTADLLRLDKEAPPLRKRRDDVCVGRSGISLDVVVNHHENGLTPEQIVKCYPVLDLADVYATIAYYLRHYADVRAYMKAHIVEGRKQRTQMQLFQEPP